MKRTIIIIWACVIALAVAAQGVLLEPKQDAKKLLWGYENPSTGKWVVKPIYNSAEPFKKGPDGQYRAIVTKGTLQGYLGADGKPLGAGIVFSKMAPMMKGDNQIVTVKGKMGIITPAAVYVQKPEITEMNPLEQEGYLITVKGKKGVISPEGVTLVAPEYSEINTSEPGFFIVKKGNKAGLLSRKGEVLLQPSKYTDIRKYGDYWKIMSGARVGLFDSTKKIVLVDAEYGDVLQPFTAQSRTIYPAMKTNGKWGAIDASGRDVITFKNQELTPVPALNAIRVYRNDVGNRLYFLKEKVYLELSQWKPRKDGPFNIIKGTIAAPTEEPQGMVGLSFKELYRYSDDFSQRKSLYNQLLGNTTFRILQDSNGNILSTNFAAIEKLGDKWLIVRYIEPWLVCDPMGSLIAQTELQGVEMYCHSKYQQWHSDGKRVIFPDLKTYKIIDCGSSMQFIDKDGNGNWIPMINDTPDFDAEAYSDVKCLGSKATVCRDGKWGLFVNGKLVIDCKYPTELRDSDIGGCIETGAKGTLGLLTTDGTELLAPQYDSFETVWGWNRKDYIGVHKNEYVGVYNTSSRTWILPLSKKMLGYDFFNEKRDSPILIYNGKWGMADAEGNIIIPTSYDKETVKFRYLNPQMVKSTSGSQAKSQRKSSKGQHHEQDNSKGKGSSQFQESKDKRRF